MTEPDSYPMTRGVRRGTRTMNLKSGNHYRKDVKPQTSMYNLPVKGKDELQQTKAEKATYFIRDSLSAPSNPQPRPEKRSLAPK